MRYCPKIQSFGNPEPYRVQGYPEYEEAAKRIVATTNGQEKVWIIFQEDDGFDFAKIKYLILPTQCNADHFSITNPSDFNADQWASELEKDRYDYVYLQHINESFTTNFSNLFVSGDALQDHQLYKVLKVDGQIRLGEVY